jgi:hypothetical protein
MRYRLSSIMFHNKPVRRVAKIRRTGGQIFFALQNSFTLATGLHVPV